MSASDEVSALSAIYCKKDEFLLLEESGDRGYVFCVNTLLEGRPVSVLFRLPPEYPRCVPEICVRSEDLSRARCQEVKERLQEKAARLLPEPMVQELLLFLQQGSSDWTTAASPARPDAPQQDMWTALLLLDHMRSRAKYIKTVERFAANLHLTGRLFVGKPILIILQGTRGNVKECIKLQKTVKVDVDSAGKRCKERMMTVLWESQLTEDQKQLPTFEVKEFSSIEELEREFETDGLLSLYHKFVPSLL
ncbi:RWD domain-containing protein 3 [Denticeps clupeoides]|uniref:RWD domain-containing protein 3 n=1 Tax=Denticeps clupeoides TaxID=299321 RepID=UPI0010A52C0B|nr:RWD domain-containing protein 3 [Denticeps clupeoides]